MKQKGTQRECVMDGRIRAETEVAVIASGYINTMYCRSRSQVIICSRYGCYEKSSNAYDCPARTESQSRFVKRDEIKLNKNCNILFLCNLQIFFFMVVTLHMVVTCGVLQ